MDNVSQIPSTIFKSTIDKQTGLITTRKIESVTKILLSLPQKASWSAQCEQHPKSSLDSECKYKARFLKLSSYVQLQTLTQ